MYALLTNNSAGGVFTGSAYKTYIKSYASRLLVEMNYDATIPYGGTD